MLDALKHYNFHKEYVCDKITERHEILLLLTTALSILSSRHGMILSLIDVATIMHQL